MKNECTMLYFVIGHPVRTIFDMTFNNQKPVALNCLLQVVIVRYISNE